MPYSSTGAASPDLSTFTGTNVGFGGGGGFQFGKLLQERWDMQKKMMEAQLAQMQEQRERERDAALSQEHFRKLAEKEASMKAKQKRRSPESLQRGREYQDAVEYVRGLTSGDLRTRTGGGRNPRYWQDIAGQVAAMGIPAAQQGLMQTGRLQTGGMGALVGALGRDRGGAEEEPDTTASAEGNVTGEVVPTVSSFDPNIGGADLAMLARQNLASKGGGGGSYPPGYTSTPGFYMGPGGITNMPKPLSPMEMPAIGGPSMEKGGYVPKTGPYKLHKGEIVLNPEQSKAMFPGVGPGPQKRGYQEGSVPGWLDTPISELWGAAKPSAGAAIEHALLPGSGASLRGYYGSGIADVLKGLFGPDAPTGEAVSRFLPKGGGVTFPGEEEAPTPAAEPFKPPYRVEEGGKKLIAKGQPETKAAKFQRYVDELQEKVEKSEHQEKMARARAYDLETQINKRPYADNKQLKKMMQARTQEADRHKKTQETARSEFSAIKVQQQQMESELAKAYQLNKTKQLDTAFDAIDQYWKTSVKLDDGDDKFVEYSVGMLLPYMDQLQRLGGYDSPEQTKEALRQTLSNAYERPEEYQWLKLMLQQGG